LKTISPFQQKISIPGKTAGKNSLNRGELLFLAIATCFCNDIYREAAKKMDIRSVEVIVSCESGKEGEPDSNIIYSTRIKAPSCSKKRSTILFNTFTE
jgi:organic hydroperoxide reductase OsmC/OhrA